jgi:glycosyltransferase involved in cell wall biosynthesis
MWDNNRTPVTVIEHGVTESDIPYSGELAKGVTIINHLPQRGRALGWDIFQQVAQQVPVDLAGMGNEVMGMGEVLHPQLPSFRSRYRFFFHPVRHTSLALAVCEAMMQGLPVIGLATTELVTVIENGVNGFIHTDVNYLIDKMKLLLNDPDLAMQMGKAARETALKRFNIRRFTSDWEQLFHAVCNGVQGQPLSPELCNAHIIK